MTKRAAPGAIAWCRTVAWLQDRRARRRYRTMDEAGLRASRRSDTLFVFGSGRSLTEISPEEWRHIATGDTLGFNWFVHQRFVRVDYHVIREVAHDDLDPLVWRPALVEYARLIRDNPHYATTIFVVQCGWRAANGNRMVGLELLPPDSRIFRFHNRSRGVFEPPTRRFADGLVHAAGTLNDCVNFGYILGWKTIVLAGVDPYDNRYFWLDGEETRAAVTARHAGLSHADPFPSARRQVSVFAGWRRALEAEGVTLAVYNPRSLLAEVLPVYAPPAVLSPKATRA